MLNRAVRLYGCVVDLMGGYSRVFRCIVFVVCLSVVGVL